MYAAELALPAGSQLQSGQALTFLSSEQNTSGIADTTSADFPVSGWQLMAAGGVFQSDLLVGFSLASASLLQLCNGQNRVLTPV